MNSLSEAPTCVSLWLKCRLIKNYHCYSKFKMVAMAEAMADELEDDRLDDGAIEID